MTLGVERPGLGVLAAHRAELTLAELRMSEFCSRGDGREQAYGEPVNCLAGGV